MAKSSSGILSHLIYEEMIKGKRCQIEKEQVWGGWTEPGCEVSPQKIQTTE